MHLTIRRVSLLLMVISAALATGSTCGAVTIDDFRYDSSVDAAKAWVPQSGSDEPVPAKIDGVACLRFPCDFTKNVLRDFWDKEVNLDLSAADCICCRVKISNPALVKMISVYLKAGDDVWWGSGEAIPLSTDKWQTVTLPKSSFDTQEGTLPGWNNIRRIRIAVWPGASGTTDLYVANLQTTTSASKNLLSNSGFEVCTTERMPDFWGSGFWGLNDDAFATDPGAWRARWGVDNTVSHSGKRSLRIVGKKDLWDCRLLPSGFQLKQESRIRCLHG